VSQLLCSGAQLMCSLGAAPAVLNVLPLARTLVAGRPAATTFDYQPLVNIPTFGLCASLGNPTVVAATAAALGVLTPMPCVPATATPWVPGSPTVTVGGKPGLSNTSQCLCAYGGVITVMLPGQFTTQVP
jgi:Domain of unknown function (DUF4280)